MYAKGKGFQIELSQYYGRFGNNILQMIHSIYIGEKTQSKVILKNHTAVDTKTLNRKLDFRISKNNLPKQIIRKKWLLLEDLYPHPPPSTHIISKICKTYIWPYFNNKYKPTTHTLNALKDTVIIHIRSGDIFPENLQPNSNPHDQSFRVHPKYGQPPLEYYKKIIEYEYWMFAKTDFLLVTEQDRKNPVINALERWMKDKHPLLKFAIQSDTFENDIQTLLGAKVLVSGYSTLTRIAELLSEQLKRLHTTVKDKDLQDLQDLQVFIYKFDGYSPMNEAWLGTEEQLTQMISFQSEKVIRLRLT